MSYLDDKIINTNTEINTIIKSLKGRIWIEQAKHYIELGFNFHTEAKEILDKIDNDCTQSILDQKHILLTGLTL